MTLKELLLKLPEYITYSPLISNVQFDQVDLNFKIFTLEDNLGMISLNEYLEIINNDEEIQLSIWNQNFNLNFKIDFLDMQLNYEYYFQNSTRVSNFVSMFTSIINTKIRLDKINEFLDFD